MKDLKMNLEEWKNFMVVKFINSKQHLIWKLEIFKKLLYNITLNSKNLKNRDNNMFSN